MHHEMPYTKENVMYITALMLLPNNFTLDQWAIARNESRLETDGPVFNTLENCGYITCDRNVGGSTISTMTDKAKDWLMNVPEGLSDDAN